MNTFDHLLEETKRASTYFLKNSDFGQIFTNAKALQPLCISVGFNQRSQLKSSSYFLWIFFTHFT